MNLPYVKNSQNLEPKHRSKDTKSKPSLPSRTYPVRSDDKSDQEGIPGRSLRARNRYAKGELSSSAKPASDRPNRAARRLAQYGPGDTPPRSSSSKLDVEKRRYSKPTGRSQAPTLWRADNAQYRPTAPRRLENSRDQSREYPDHHPSVISHSGNDNTNYLSHLSQGENSFAKRSRLEGRTTSDVPLAIPYTTPASEFLYGTSVVNAALKYSRRRFYKLYLYTGPDRVNTSQDTAMERLAKSKGVEVKQVHNEWLRILDKMSAGRPHNVCTYSIF